MGPYWLNNTTIGLNLTWNLLQGNLKSPGYEIADSTSLPDHPIRLVSPYRLDSLAQMNLDFLHSTGPSHNQGTFYHPLQLFADGLEQLVTFIEKIWMTMSLVQSLDESIPYEQHDMQITKSPKVSPARQGPHLEWPYGKLCMAGLLRSILWPPVESVSSLYSLNQFGAMP